MWGFAKALRTLTVPSPESHLVYRDHGESVRRPGLSSGVPPPQRAMRGGPMPTYSVYDGTVHDALGRDTAWRAWPLSHLSPVSYTTQGSSPGTRRPANRLIAPLSASHPASREACARDRYAAHAPATDPEQDHAVFALADAPASYQLVRLSNNGRG